MKFEIKERHENFQNYEERVRSELRTILRGIGCDRKMEVVDMVEHLIKNVRYEEHRQKIHRFSVRKGLNMILGLLEVINMCLKFRGPTREDLKIGRDSLERIRDCYDELRSRYYQIIPQLSALFIRKLPENNTNVHKRREVKKLQEEERSIDEGTEDAVETDSLNEGTEDNVETDSLNKGTEDNVETDSLNEGTEDNVETDSLNEVTEYNAEIDSLNEATDYNAEKDSLNGGSEADYLTLL